MMQFPHCDARILHAPKKCIFCDAHPDWQKLREAWEIAYTSQKPKRIDEPMGAGVTRTRYQMECPADRARPEGTMSDHRLWGGNVAYTEEESASIFKPEWFLTYEPSFRVRLTDRLSALLAKVFK